MTSPERLALRQYAANAKTAASQHLAWALDQLRLTVGLVECIDFEQLPSTPGARLVLCHRPCAPYAHFHAVSDTEVISS